VIDLQAIDMWLESMPVAVVAMDGQHRLRAANHAALRILGVDELKGVCGDHGLGTIIECINTLIYDGACGSTPACRDCAVFQTANTALDGDLVSQREVHIRQVTGDREIDRVFLISAAPFRGEVITGIRVLVVLQEVTDLHRLRGLIPICARCKNIRRDDEAWERLERFIEERSYAVFTHSLCPRCLAEFYPQI
jgi:PAS domain-containing protein